MLNGLEQIITRLKGYNPWVVLVELTLIWAVVWVILRFLRGTRGARLLKGFLLLVVVVAVLGGMLEGPGEAQFERLRFLLGIFLTFAAFALIVVFQPELRRGLVRLGEARFFRGSPMVMDSVIDELVSAAEYLSKHKIGAIIAIERSVGLEGVVEAGTRLGAYVSADLLKTIFWPGSALHDMGVIIRGDRVVSAGVQFPLAEGEELSQELGSRHRAAIGLSQETDSLVLVVSEETGAISLAERGQLIRKLSPEFLRSMLNRGLSQPPGQGRGEPGASPSSQPREQASDVSEHRIAAGKPVG